MANPTRAARNFDFSVNTGLDGTTNTLDAFDFRIVITSGDGEQGVFDLRHVGAGNTPWLNSTNTAGFADEDGINPQLSQNSVNIGFAFLTWIFGADARECGRDLRHQVAGIRPREDHRAGARYALAGLALGPGHASKGRGASRAPFRVFPTIELVQWPARHTRRPPDAPIIQPGV